MDKVFSEGRSFGQIKFSVCLVKLGPKCNFLQPLDQWPKPTLRARYSKQIFSTDASPSGGAVIAAPVSSHTTEELWRHSEQRGLYTKLVSPVSQILLEKGIEPEAVQFAPDSIPPETEHCVNIPAILQEGILYDCVELFSGFGSWSHAHAERGLVVHDGYDISGACIRISDLSDRSVVQELVALL